MGNNGSRLRPLVMLACLALVGLPAVLALAYDTGVGGALAAAQERIPGVPRVPNSTSLVLSQVYGGGGNTGAPWHNDFIEVFNPTAAAVDVTGWSVQYASATGTTWQLTNLNGTIPPGGYYLVQEAAGTGGGNPLPTPDATGAINMSSAQGKVALVNNTTALTCGVRPSNPCLPNPNIIDFVGYGAVSTVQDWEGSGPTGALSNTSSALRNGDGCTDTDDNAADFTVATTIVPRNSSSPQGTCGPTSPTSTFTPSNTPQPGSPTSTFTPLPSAPALIYMLHYTQYDTTNRGDEAVRLINISQAPLSIAGWQVVDTSGSVTLPAGVTMPAGSKIWIANRATVFKGLFGFNPDFEYGADTDPNVPQAAATAGYNFPDNGDAVRLVNAAAGNVDTIVYKSGNISSLGWSGASVKPYLPAGQPTFTEDGQILYRKLDQVTAAPVPDTNTQDDWAQDNDPTGSSPTPGREYDDINGKKLLKPGWPLTDPALEDMFFTKKYTDTNVTTKFLVGPDNEFGAVRDTILNASQTITIETYEWHHAILNQEIINAKNRGVRIHIVIDGNPCCLSPPRPDDETLWAAKQWEDAGIPVYFFSGYPTTTDDEYRFNNVHAKIMIVDDRWVVTGSDNFSTSGMPTDPTNNGTAGARGMMIITNAPDVVAYTRRLVNNDTDITKYGDLPRYPALGTPPPGYSSTPFPDMTGYTPLKPTPLVVTETESIEIVQSPDNELRDEDSLIGLVNRAGPGDEVMVEQQYERKFWETSVTAGPNPRLEAYIRAARRGANVRIMLDGFFEGGDCTSTTHNPASVAYVNGMGLPNLQARVGEPTSGQPVGQPTATTGNIHNKMVLVKVGPLGYSHITSINGSANASKNNREYGFQIQSNAGYQYFKEVFDWDWGVGYVPCGPTPTPRATSTGTQTPATATPTATGQPELPCNVLTNWTFESGNLSPWATTAVTLTAAVSTAVPHTGSYSVAVTHAFTATGGGSQGIYQDVPNIIAGTSYAVQGYVYRPDNNIQSARVRVAWYTCPDYSCSQASTTDVFAGNRGVVGWQFFSGSVTAPAGALAARYRLISYNAEAINSTIYYDDVGMACNPGAPTFTPTPGPSTTAVSTVTNTPTWTPSASRTPTATSTTGGAGTPTATNTTGVPLTPTPTNTTSVPLTPTATNTTGAVGTATPTNTTGTARTSTPTATSPAGTNTNTPVRTATNTPGGSVTGTPATTATPCAISFTDVPTDAYFYSGVHWLYCHGAISGYADNTFRPYVYTTRGQMAKIVVLANGLPLYTPVAPTFRDVLRTNAFFVYIETAARNMIVSGYTCGEPGEPCPGAYFRPGNLVTRGQLAKFVVVAAGWPVINPTTPRFNDVPQDSAFYSFVETGFCRQVFTGYDCGGPGEPCPGLYFRPGSNATRGQISKMVYEAVQDHDCLP
ncbi:MAG: lamin tail domain-containing protein [Chloroflexia bacterium]